jgi:hypothetical protein
MVFGWMVPLMKGSAELLTMVSYGLFSITTTTTLSGWTDARAGDPGV